MRLTVDIFFSGYVTFIHFYLSTRQAVWVLVILPQCLDCMQAVEEAKSAKKDKWLKEHQGQLLIAAGHDKLDQRV